MPSVPMVFVHGLWLHGSSWQPWVELFTALGHDATVVSWPGEALSVGETRINAASMPSYGLQQLTHHVAWVLSTFDELPVVVGHSVGASVARHLAARGMARAAVAIAPLPTGRNVAWNPSLSAATAPIFVRRHNRSRVVELSQRQFKRVVATRQSDGHAADLYRRWAVPSVAQPLFEVAEGYLSKRRASDERSSQSTSAPVLFLAGTDDVFAPPAVVAREQRKYARHGPSDLTIIPGADHSVTISDRWSSAAATVQGWMHSLQ